MQNRLPHHFRIADSRRVDDRAAEDAQEVRALKSRGMYRGKLVIPRNEIGFPDKNLDFRALGSRAPCFEPRAGSGDAGLLLL